MMAGLFGAEEVIEIATEAKLLPGFALRHDAVLMGTINEIAAAAPFRHMETRRGYKMSVAMTNCGKIGWVSDRRGYRYQETDPLTGKPWPEMPDLFRALAVDAAAKAGFANFSPDACLINRYEVGAKMGLHQDKDEKDLGAPIVSFSLGLSAVFQFGGLERSDPVRKIALQHGDAIVWGGASRLAYHGIMPLKAGEGLVPYRYNLTFRKVR